ncbi:hypothetical protein [Streptosporangium sp. OZ121]|uniref:hypothetical protein n=1 Tax=Streptosporangium sp. OZ121 TaxID=3444183 RepID=UPI003F78BAD2
MILLLVMALAALPSVGAAASRSLGCPSHPTEVAAQEVTEVTSQEVIDFWKRHTASQRPEPAPAPVSDEGRYSDSKAGMIPPIGIEIVSSLNCPARP